MSSAYSLRPLLRRLRSDTLPLPLPLPLPCLRPDWCEVRWLLPRLLPPSESSIYRSLGGSRFSTRSISLSSMSPFSSLHCSLTLTSFRNRCSSRCFHSFLRFDIGPSSSIEQSSNFTSSTPMCVYDMRAVANLSRNSDLRCVGEVAYDPCWWTGYVASKTKRF